MLSVARGEDRRHSHRKVSFTHYATRSQVQRTTRTCSLVQTVLLGAYLGVRLANAHFEVAHSVYKHTTNRLSDKASPSAIIHYSLFIINFNSVAAMTASKSGVGVPSNRKYQADNLAKLWQEFLSVCELIAKIFGAVSRTKA